MLNLHWKKLVVIVLLMPLLCACNSSSTSAQTSSEEDDPLVTTYSSLNVLCAYSENTYNSSPSVSSTSISQWTCSSSTRDLSANGLPDHAVGIFPNSANPNFISAQTVAASFTLAPSFTSQVTNLGGPLGATGFILNGVKIDAGTGGTCDDRGLSCDMVGNTGSWNIEALGQAKFDFGIDENNAHVQPDGAYHYHGMPEGFLTKMGADNSKMTLIGWAVDGFPIYARYGYSDANDATTSVVVMTGSYQLVSAISGNRPSVSDFEMGIFLQDWVYVEGIGDLDECNGRTGVTPEFPEGIYHYFATDSYPYFQRCVKGIVQGVAP